MLRLRGCFILISFFFAYDWRSVTAVPPASRASSCGYDSCPETKEGVINVHIVAHTHDDVGWLKTIDQYYEGSSSHYQKAGVRYILDSVIKELQKDPTRRFIYVEMAFFSQWWNEQTEATQAIVRQLVQEGRLEFIGGGWCMNDEAATHYADIIDQMSWGFRFLNDTFGECGRPRVAWQIDPFGHSREQANLFALMGFDGVFFGRIDWEDRSRRKTDKEMEMIWQASNSLGERGSLFTGILYDHYTAPPGFCFDFTCSTDKDPVNTPFIDNPKSPEYNIPQKVNELMGHIKRRAKAFATNNLLLPMGADFNYMSANKNFKNMDKMIRYTNEMEPTVNLFYSTPSCYLKAVNEAGINQWPIKTDDFFPYSNDPHAYWTGYFTSRAAYKGTVRRASTYLQSCKQLHSLSGRTDGQDLIDNLRRSMAEAQHHDAVAGTEKSHVDQDYRWRLHESVMDCQQDFARSLEGIVRIGNQPLPEQQFCPELNVSRCEPTESGSRFVVTAYNPLSRHVTSYIRLPVRMAPAGAESYTVFDPAGSELVVQLLPIKGSAVQPNATHELIFQAAGLPPLGHKSFYVLKTARAMTHHQPGKVWRPRTGDGPITISNGLVTASFDADGLMDAIIVDGQPIPLRQSLMWYAGMGKGSTGSYFDDRASGAYVLRPNGTDAMDIAARATITVTTGPVVQEVHQQFSDWASQVVRLYKGQRHVEIEWTVGPIPVDDGVGKEIISRVETGLPSNGLFYTDSNGRQTLQRKRDYRSTWTLNVSEPVAENYYPINSHIYIRDEDPSGVMVALINDRAQGGTSLKDGQIELMVHRRLLYDDDFGVGEPLNELGDGPGLIVRGTHYLLVGVGNKEEHPMSLIRPLVQEATGKPWLSFSITDMSYTQWKNNYLTQKSGLKRALPDNVHILTLEPWMEDGTHLLRLEHVVDVGEHPVLAEPVTLDLADLLDDYTITSAEETMLGANQWASDSVRLPWNFTASSTGGGGRSGGNPAQDDLLSITLEPMDIRTFIIRMTMKKK